MVLSMKHEEYRTERNRNFYRTEYIFIHLDIENQVLLT